MCGRYLSLSSPDELAEHFGVDTVRLEPREPRYNVAPSTLVPAIIEHNAERRLGELHWGFMPWWAKQLRGSPKPINARVESVATNRMFAPAFERQRCILPADGFYEWLDRGEGRAKQPFHIADPDGQPLAFAGIWSIWQDPNDPEAPARSTAAIITTAAAGHMERIHHRMPVILPPTLWSTWLGPTDDAPHLAETIQALGAPRLVATEISDRVNNVRNEGPELIEAGTVDP